MNLREFNKEFVYHEDGNFTVGASIRLQRLINTVNQYGYGGIEYLYSVPGLTGGAILMNAGGARSEGKQISDFIVSVNTLYKGEPVTLSKEECLFSHRSSIFKKDKNYVIVSADFSFPKQSPEVSEEKIRARMALVEKIHDTAFPNFGSVFQVYDPYIMAFVRKIQRKKNSGVWFSGKTDNWLINCGDGTYGMAIKRINAVKKIHRILHRECATEVIIWD